jgi:prepilin-type N-terminal cleavage/methylation domain-containing protein
MTGLGKTYLIKYIFALCIRMIYNSCSGKLRGIIMLDRQADKQIDRLKPCHCEAFTLAEVLITLGIIGIVAAITIPTLMNNIQDQQYKVAYKKAFSIANQAFLSANSDDLLASREDSDIVNEQKNNFKAFKSYFKVSKDCNMGNNSNCWANGELFLGMPTSTADAFVDTSGMAWVSWEAVGWDGLFVDTNGNKSPNKFGQDRFYFFISTPNKDYYSGIPSKVLPHVDCLSTTSCNGNNYLDVCPSVSFHPCKYKGWLLGE